MNPAEIAHVQAVISAVLQFMIVLGVVAFLRGIYIIREVAEGNGQASLMAGITHMVGGSLAVNLGPVMNAAQNTLGLTAYGVNFN
jgi:intracellular multiplication protein IcmC